MDLKEGPNWVGLREDTAIVVNKTSQGYYKEPFFYALGHFSKFLIPDSVKVHSTEKSRLDKFETTVFVRPDNATVIIALNLSDDSVEINIDNIDDSVDGKFSHIVRP